MRVRYLDPDLAALSEHERRYVAPSQLFFSASKEYEVHAVSVYDGVSFLLVVDDRNGISFDVRALFELVDATIPEDWICSVFPTGPVQLVIGPAFLAKDLGAYDGMVDHASPQFESFWSRIERRSKVQARVLPLAGDRRLVLCAVGSDLEWGRRGPFAALIPADYEVDTQRVGALVDRLVDAGCREVCFVGTEANALEDAMDALIEARGAFEVVTTAFTDTTEACEYFLLVAGDAPGSLYAFTNEHPDEEDALVRAIDRCLLTP